MRLEINRIVKFHLFPNSAVINDGIISKTIDNERILSNLNLLDKNGNNTVRGRIINPIPCGALILTKNTRYLSNILPIVEFAKKSGTVPSWLYLGL